MRAVEEIPAREAWPEALLAPYLERRLEELAASAQMKVALERGLREERPAGSDAVIQQALGKTARIWRRPDGKPVFFGDEDISAAHADDFTLAVAGAAGAACDLETVAARTDAEWRDLLGGEKFNSRSDCARQVESVDTAATRLWAAMECLKKIGQPLAIAAGAGNKYGRWLDAAAFRLVTIATCAVMVRGNQLPLALAVALKSRAEIQPACPRVPRPRNRRA